MGLLLVTPDAEPLVGIWRVDHDWAARCGIPAHVTVRDPFLEPPLWPDVLPLQLQAFLPIEVTLARLEDRPGALVIVVEPDDRLRQLTRAVSAVWPALRPHKGDHAHFAYHVTVVRTRDDAIRSRAWEEIASRLPLGVEGTELWAAHGSPDAGADHKALAAGPGGCCS